MEKYSPVTSRIGFLELAVDDAAEALRSWRQKLRGRSVATRLDGGFEENVGRLEPLTSHVRPRELVVATAGSQWTAFFDCGYLGGNQSGTVGHLSRSLGVRGVHVSYVPDTYNKGDGTGRYGALQFNLLDPQRAVAHGVLRSISLVNDGGSWDLDVFGTPQSFEDTSTYTMRRATDRFTYEQLTHYTAAVGLRPFALDFYPGPSVLVVSPVQAPPDARSMTIKEAHAFIHSAW